MTLISIIKPVPFQRIASSEKAGINVGPGQKTQESSFKKTQNWTAARNSSGDMLGVACLCLGGDHEPVIALLVLNPSGCSGLPQ